MEDLNINNYIFERPLTNDNSGFSKWGIGHRGQEDYFVKEFLSPTYPADLDAFDSEQLKGKLSECSEFEEEKKKLYLAINNLSDGHLMRIHQFFRVKAKYYMVTEAVLDKTLSIQEIAALSYRDRLTVCCAVAHAVSLLHREKIVHADIKPDNILVTKGKFVRTHIIDFDCSFFEMDRPEPDEELNGDLVYLSPEAFLHMAEVESNLSCQMDVFALGLVFHQYLTGKLPRFDTEAYTYAYEAVLDGQPILPDRRVGSERIRGVLYSMLKKKPEERLSMNTVYQTFREELCAVVGRPVSGESAAEKDMPERNVPKKDEARIERPKPEDASRYFSAAGDL